MEKFITQLTSSSYWTLNKDLCRNIGIQNTLLLQHFIDLQYKLFGGKEFYQQQDRIQEELGLKEWSVKQSINFLLKENLISVEKKGIPAKNWYLINEEKLLSIINSKTSNKSGENHLTSTDNSTSQRKELNKKELKEKEDQVSKQEILDKLNNLNKTKAINKAESNKKSFNRLEQLLNNPIKL
jgi:hypothetical protein